MAGPDDPYRVLFHQLSVGAARFRIVSDAVEIVDANPAFAAFRPVVPELVEIVSRARTHPESVQLRVGARVMSVAAYPAGLDVMVVIEDVTTREVLEQRSRESQNRFEKAFYGNAAAMVIAKQSDLRIIDVNPRWLELFGTTRDEVIGRTATELGLITEANARERIAQHQVFSDGYDTELALLTRAGGHLTVLASAKPIELAEGHCTLTTLIDITGRKHAEEAFAVAFSASPAGMMLVHGTNNLVVAVNNRLLEMTGYARDELVGRDAASIDLVRKPSRDELLAELQRTGRLNGVELELARKHGPNVPTLSSSEVIVLHDVPHRLSVFTDITVRKRFEDRLLTQHAIGGALAELAGVETALPRVLEALCRGEGWNCGAAWLAGSGGLTCRALWYDDDRARELATFTRGTTLAANVGLLGRVLVTGLPEETILDPERGPHGAAAFGAGMRCALAFPILRGTEVLGVVGLAARDEHAPFDTAERGLLDSVGRMLGLFVERTRAEASLRELNVELEHRIRERTQALETTNRDLESFTSSVSHDLRAPLRTIQGFSNILLEDFGSSLPAEAKGLLASIHASGGRLRNLIDDLLAFSRLGRQGLRRVDVDLDTLVKSVLDELVAGRGLGDRLELRLQPLGTCHADESLLRAVWTNLIDNALKYSRDRERIVVEIVREVRATETVYLVRDNGVGFDMRYADRLFGVFQRLHAAKDFEGTGVGLANVRRIVERHRGRVAATSVLGEGSTFEFTLGS